MYIQQQRQPDDYRDALKFPRVLHLAELAHEYALPYEAYAAFTARPADTGG